MNWYRLYSDQDDVKDYASVMVKEWNGSGPTYEMTKEMRPSHREDVLVHALTYYGIKSKEKLSNKVVLGIIILLCLSSTLHSKTYP